ncbi:MAG: chaperone modulator CbpM [Burkholderiales bacterium]|jgi:chaperone modulatory protein CbpM
MELQETDAMWLDDRLAFSFAELARFSCLTETELRELAEYGALVPINPQDAEWTFSGDMVLRVQVAGRLRDDLELDAQALALALTLMGRIRDLEAQLCSLRAQLPRRLP